MLLACAPFAPLHAQLMSVADGPIPVGSSYIIGLVMEPNQASYLVTAAELYQVTNLSSGPTTTKLFVASDFVDNLYSSSRVAPYPLDSNQLVYTSITGFAPATSSMTITAPHFVVVTNLPALSDNPSIAFDPSGNLYSYGPLGAGIIKYDYQSAGAPTLFTTGTSGPGTLTGTGPLDVVNNVIYALDESGNRVVRFDATSGAYLSAFAVTGDNAFSAMAVSSNGRLYLTTGNGDGNIYDAGTGALLGSFDPTTSFSTDHLTSMDGIAIDNSTGLVVEENPATGIHTFDDPAILSAVPEQSNTVVFAGLAAVGLVLGVRARRPRVAV